MTYKEPLPSQCPPDDATDKPLKSVCRFLPFPEADPRNFHSHHMLGKPTGNASECRSKSVSLFEAGAVPNVLAAKRTAFFKKWKIGLLNVPAGAGLSKEAGTGHIDWWLYASFDPIPAMVCVCDSTDELKQAVDNAS